jgi:hypothetical protein
LCLKINAGSDLGFDQDGLSLNFREVLAPENAMAEAVEVGQKRALRDEELEAPEAKQARQEAEVNGQAGAAP